MPNFPLKQCYFKNRNAMTIGYQTLGDPNRFPIVFCNGLGGNYFIYHFLMQQLQDDYFLICWDYRGLYSSDPPPDKTSFTMEDHMEDLEDFIDHLKLSQAIFVGWSMGVQVCLEFYVRKPDCISAMVLLNGTYGNIFDSVFNSSTIKYIIPTALNIGQKIHKPYAFLLRQMARSSHFNKIANYFFLMREDIPAPLHQELLAYYTSMNFDYYFKIMQELGKHNALSSLQTIQCPVLVIAGDKDIITPLKASKKLAENLPNAELIIYPNATHFVLFEFTQSVNETIKTFLSKLSLQN